MATELKPTGANLGGDSNLLQVPLIQKTDKDLHSKSNHSMKSLGIRSKNDSRDGSPEDPHAHHSKFLEIFSPINETLKELEKALMEIPEEDEDKIIFPWDEDLQEFVVQDYHKILTIDKLSEADIEGVFYALKQSEYFNLYGKMHFYLMIPFLAVLSLIVVLIVVYQDYIGSSLKSAIVFFMIVVLVVFGLIIGMSLYWSNLLKDRLHLREVNFQEILDRLNKEMFIAKDVSWKTGHYGTYIELDIHHNLTELRMSQRKNTCQKIQELKEVQQKEKKDTKPQ